MNNDEKMTTNEILDIFSNKEERPSTEFEKNLKAECLKNFSAKKPNFILSIMEKSKKLLIAGGAFLVLLVAIGVPVTVITLKNRGNNKGDDVVDVNAKLAQTNLEELLINAIKSNNGNLISKSSSRNQTAINESGDMSLTATVESLSTSYVGIPSNAEWTDFNYTYWKNTYTKGPAADKCQFGWYDQLSDKVIYEGYNYWDSSNPMDYSLGKYKSTSKTADGTLIDYSLSDGNSNFVYRGGKYAVLETYSYLIYGLYEDTNTMVDEVSEGNPDEISTEPSHDEMYDGVDISTTNPESPENPVDLIELYFGEDAKLITYEIYNGEYHFVVEWTTNDYYCGQNEQITVVNRVWIRESDYNWSKNEMYFGSVKETNLISRDETISVNKNVTFEEVSDKFNNEYSNIETKEFKYDYSYFSPEQEKPRIKKVLTENQFSVIIPTDMELSYVSSYLTYAYYIDPYFELYCNRDFYSDGEFGDKLYKMNCENNSLLVGTIEEADYIYIEPELSFAINTPVDDNTINPEYYWISIFPKETLESDLLKMNFSQNSHSDEYEQVEEYKLLGNKNLTIGGTTVIAKVYSQTSTYSYGIKESSIDGITSIEKVPGTEEKNEKNQTVIMIFNYDNMVYIIGNYQYNNEITITELPATFSSYNTANLSQRNALFVLIDKMYENLQRDIVLYQEVYQEDSVSVR